MTIHGEFVRETKVIKIVSRKGNWNVRRKAYWEDAQGQDLNTNSVLKNIKNHVDLNKCWLNGMDAPLISIDCGMLVHKQCSRRYDKAISYMHWCLCKCGLESNVPVHTW